jgi:hypothetical protein
MMGITGLMSVLGTPKSSESSPYQQVGIGASTLATYREDTNNPTGIVLLEGVFRAKRPTGVSVVLLSVSDSISKIPIR